MIIMFESQRLRAKRDTIRLSPADRKNVRTALKNQWSDARWYELILASLDTEKTEIERPWSHSYGNRLTLILDLQDRPDGVDAVFAECRIFRRPWA